MIKIMETKNYSMFELHEINRNVVKTKRLEASMLQHGWIDAYPAHVVKNGHNKFKIKAGHHRFIVAKKLGISVKYVVCDDTITIHELETASIAWSLRDYLTSFCRAGLPDYVILQEYCNKYHFSIGDAISLLSGAASGSNNYQYAFKSGAYKIRYTALADMVGEIVNCMAASGVPKPNARTLVNAVSKLVLTPQFDPKRMVEKIEKYPNLITLQTTADGYLQVLEECYNYHSKGKKVPLAYLAKEESAKRNPAVKKG